jgi:uncharacterized membrane protein HdeD (DUF308 family)
MVYAHTPEEIAFGDHVAERLEKIWGWYLVTGIAGILFGFVLVSYRHDSFSALTYFASGFFLATGIAQFVAGVTLPRHRWIYILMGVVSMVVGVLFFRWPHITIYVVSILIAWTFFLYGVTDIIHAMHSRQFPHWWVHLIRGVLFLALAFLVLRHPGDTVSAFTFLIGVGSMLFGLIEIFSAFSARHATSHWAALKAKHA